MTEHKHAAVLRAIADGKAIEFNDGHGWREPVQTDVMNPIARYNLDWRIKPEARTPRRIWVEEVDGKLWHYHTVALTDEEPPEHFVEFVEVLDE